MGIRIIIWITIRIIYVGGYELVYGLRYESGYELGHGMLRIWVGIWPGIGIRVWNGISTRMWIRK